MACPFFYPIERLDDGAWLNPPRLPLGDPCRGECHAIPEAPLQPTAEQMRSFCNLGYARERCPHFPSPSDAPDAVRFSVAADHDGEVALVYILEKDYGPETHGLLHFNTGTRLFAGRVDSPSLEAQAIRFLSSYLERKLGA